MSGGTITALSSMDGFFGQVRRLVESAGHQMTERHISRLEERVVPHLRNHTTPPQVDVRVRTCGRGYQLFVFHDGMELTGQPS